jgi:D-alanyl-lipoteichoic acid acyltransferase DltB (MBOAT superfamily)
METRRDPRRVDTSRAFYLIATGLFKKVVIANYLATHITDQVFAVPGSHSSAEILVATYAYAVQIYADFSGYTDMAIGIALLLGFKFPQNFDSPYTATSLQSFWRRWHVTLSRWLRDYLYIRSAKLERARPHLRQPDGDDAARQALGTARRGRS